MDNFKGQITPMIMELIEQNIHISLLQPNTTDQLQKGLCTKKIRGLVCYTNYKQLSGHEDIESVELQPIDLGMSVLKELGHEWLVETLAYIADNPHIVVRFSIRLGITQWKRY